MARTKSSRTAQPAGIPVTLQWGEERAENLNLALQVDQQLASWFASWLQNEMEAHQLHYANVTLPDGTEKVIDVRIEFYSTVRVSFDIPQEG